MADVDLQRPAIDTVRILQKFASSQRLDVYTHTHAEFIFRIAPIAAAQRDSLTGRPGDRYPDQVAISDDAIGRIELNPARTRQVNLAPRVGRATSKPYWAVSVGHVDIPRDEPRGEPSNRAASIISNAKSLQEPFWLRIVSDGVCVP